MIKRLRCWFMTAWRGVTCSVHATAAAFLCCLALESIARVSAVDVPIGSPSGITVDAGGNVYFSSPNIVYKLSSNGSLSRIAGNGSPGFGGDGGKATEALLNFPLVYPELEADPIDFWKLVAGLAVDPSGNVYIADAYNGRVRRVDGNGIISSISTVDARLGGPASDTKFGWPQGVAMDAQGTLYVSNQWGEIYSLSPDGLRARIATFNCGPGWAGPGVCIPEQIAVDAAGNVFVGDGYCRVRKVSPDGRIVTVAGDGRPSPGFAFTCGYSGDGGPATSAALGSLPYGVAVDGAGNLFIADTGNSCVRRVGLDGIISTVAGICLRPGFDGDGRLAVSAMLSAPDGVAVDADGAVYIADTGNNRIRKVNRDGRIVTVAGNGSARITLDDIIVAPIAIDSRFTGAWYDPAQKGHGVFVEVLPDNRFLAWWFTFNPSGTEQAWFGGVGTYSGDTAVVTEVNQTTGGRFIPNFNPATIVNNPWGQLTFRFTDCNHGSLAFESIRGYGPGTMNLTRLTLPAGLACVDAK